MATLAPSTRHYLAVLDPDQQLIDATIAELLEQLQHAQRDIVNNAYSYPVSLPDYLDPYTSFWHLDAELELLGKHSFPYFEHTEVYE